jgi:hypothetical protein
VLGVGVIRGSNFDDVSCNKVDTLETSDDRAEFSGAPPASLRGTGGRRNYGRGKWLAVGHSTVDKGTLKLTPCNAHGTKVNDQLCRTRGQKWKKEGG